jgi:hypothetical protein
MRAGPAAKDRRGHGPTIVTILPVCLTGSQLEASKLHAREVPKSCHGAAEGEKAH